MKTELKTAAKQLAFIAACIAVAYFVAGCRSGAPKAKDAQLKGMYANTATETVAIGSAKITVLPDSLESFIAHYSEDTAWLSPSTKTHTLDIYMTGTNSSQNATQVIESICKAFAEVAPPVKSQLGSDSVKGVNGAADTTDGKIKEEE